MSSPERRRIRPTCAEIDLVALQSNLGEARKRAGASALLGVVKANAYGHGAVQVAQTLEDAGVHQLGVALIEEGLELRAAGIKTEILVLGGAYEGGYEAMVDANLTPTIFRPEHLTQLATAAQARDRTVDVHLKLDTGMGRIGARPEDLPALLALARDLTRVRIDGVLSHFANADLADAALTREQIARFKQGVGQIRAAGFDPTWRHLSNSAGVIDLPEVHDGLELNLVRPGLMLYGVAPAAWLGEQVSLEPVMRWKTAITHLKTVPVGTPISYGSTWVAARESKIATLPVGYADGYGRTFSSAAPVLIRGKRAKIAGRVCMDMCMVDVTDVPEVEMGDEVVLLGRQGDDQITADELAALAKTINYEILCAVSARVPREVRK